MGQGFVMVILFPENPLSCPTLSITTSFLLEANDMVDYLLVIMVDCKHFYETAF